MDALRNVLLLDVDELAHPVPRVGLSCSNVSIDGLLLFLFLVPAVSGARGGHACEQVVPQQRGGRNPHIHHRETTRKAAHAHHGRTRSCAIHTWN